jgi:hypothetical protein
VGPDAARGATSGFRREPVALARAEGGRRTEPPVDVKSLHAKIGQLALENDFLEHALGKAGLLSAKR